MPVTVCVLGRNVSFISLSWTLKTWWETVIAPYSMCEDMQEKEKQSNTTQVLGPHIMQSVLFDHHNNFQAETSTPFCYMPTQMFLCWLIINLHIMTFHVLGSSNLVSPIKFRLQTLQFCFSQNYSWMYPFEQQGFLVLVSCIVSHLSLYLTDISCMQGLYYTNTSPSWIHLLGLV